MSETRAPELLGQTVVVIGGSAGIGLETARRVRAEGADVILTGRDRDRLEQAVADVGAVQSAAFDATDLDRLAAGGSTCLARTPCTSCSCPTVSWTSVRGRCGGPSRSASGANGWRRPTPTPASGT